MTNEMINQKVIEREALQAQIKALTAEMDKITAELKSELDSRNADTIVTDTFNLFYLLQQKKSFNSKKFKADHPEDYAQYCDEKVNTYFTITRTVDAKGV